MALSKSVEDSLKEAEGNLRNALAYAARQERPIVCNGISKLIIDINNITSFDELLDNIDQSIQIDK